MLNTKKYFPIIQTFILLAFSAQGVLAAEEGIKNPISFSSLEALIANIVKSMLGLTAVLAVGFIVYGGFLYITAAGDDSQIKKGKEALMGAIIGIIVIGLAYAIVQFVIGAVGGGGSGSGVGGGVNN